MIPQGIIVGVILDHSKNSENLRRPDDPEVP
jgi:hypothetical protein